MLVGHRQSKSSLNVLLECHERTMGVGNRGHTMPNPRKLLVVFLVLVKVVLVEDILMFRNLVVHVLHLGRHPLEVALDNPNLLSPRNRVHLHEPTRFYCC